MGKFIVLIISLVIMGTTVYARCSKEEIQVANNTIRNVKQLEKEILKMELKGEENLAKYKEGKIDLSEIIRFADDQIVTLFSKIEPIRKQINLVKYCYSQNKTYLKQILFESERLFTSYSKITEFRNVSIRYAIGNKRVQDIKNVISDFPAREEIFDGASALHAAIGVESKEIFQLLLSANVNINKYSKEFNGTPIKVAVRLQNEHFVDLLLGQNDIEMEPLTSEVTNLSAKWVQIVHRPKTDNLGKFLWTITDVAYETLKKIEIDYYYRKVSTTELNIAKDIYKKIFNRYPLQIYFVPDYKIVL